MTNLERDILEILKAGPANLDKIEWNVYSANRTITNSDVQDAIILLHNIGKISFDVSTREYRIVNHCSEPTVKWTPESIQSALAEELTDSSFRSVEYLDWWARSVGIKTADLFHVLASSPEFVYREWTEGQGDWVWTLEGDECKLKPLGPGEIVFDECDAILDSAKRVHATGATRDADAEDERYDLISPIAMKRLAKIYAYGAKHHGVMNWERGLPATECISRAMRHIGQHLAGDRSEDMLAKAAWNLFGAMHSEAMWPELNRGTLRAPGCIAPGCPGYIDPVDADAVDESVEGQVSPLLQRRLDEMSRNGTIIN